jgi:ribosomal protein S18 acetylase RimI-like enzyme
MAMSKLAGRSPQATSLGKEKRMDTGVVIRKALMADLDGVSGVFAESNRFHAGLVPHVIRVGEPVMTRNWFERVLAEPEQALFVAQLGEEVAGILLAALRTSTEDPILQPRRYAYVDEIAVATAHQGQGLGRALMAVAERWAWAQGASEIELQVWEANRPAIAFYQKLGYSTARRTMRRELGPVPATATLDQSSQKR